VRGLLALFLGLAAACGDVDILFVVRSGTVAADAFCDASGGSFGMRDQQGLTIAVVITDDTKIVLASGGNGRCSDITGGALAEVQGNEKGGTIDAKSVHLGAG